MEDYIEGRNSGREGERGNQVFKGGKEARLEALEME